MIQANFDALVGDDYGLSYHKPQNFPYAIPHTHFHKLQNTQYIAGGNCKKKSVSACSAEGTENGVT